MSSIIEDIYLGRRGNIETMKPSEEYRKAQEIMCKQYNNLVQQLTEKQQNALEELYSILGELEAEHGFSRYKEGFKIGLLVAIETLL